MRAPPGAFRLPALRAGFVACLLLPWAAVPLPAETVGDARRAVRASLPRYDPAIREAHLAAQAAAAEAPLPSAKPAAVAHPPPDSDTFVLDPITVWAKPDAKLPTPLPRTPLFRPVRDLPGEPFESPKAREARLVKKHLGPVGQVLNKIRLPFIGPIFSANVRQAEAELQRAQQLNGIADAIDTGTLVGQDPELIKKLRQEYLRLYYTGPK